MTLFVSTLNQMVFLVLLIGIGFLLSRTKIVPHGTAAILSKIENAVFIPALTLSTFIGNFTVETLSASWKTVLVGLAVGVLPIPLCFVISRLCTKDEDIRKTYVYGLAFSNFGFMGYAVVQALFPEDFVHYLIFTLPIYVVVYLWGYPKLLIPSDGEHGVRGVLRSLCNPMLIGTLIGMIVGISGLKLPAFINTAMSSLGACMSPVAMILTGITIAEMPFSKIIRIKGIYLLTVLRLLVFPLVFGFLLRFAGLDRTTYLCAICVLAMPLGLSTVVVPAGYGKDTSVAAGMALVSHILSVVTIPLVFLLLM